MPTPLRLNIKYMDRMSKKKRDLNVQVSFGGCKQEEDGGGNHGHGHGHGHGDKNAGRSQKGPNFVIIESKGGGQNVAKPNLT